MPSGLLRFPLFRFVAMRNGSYRADENQSGCVVQNFNINMWRTKQPALPGHYDLVTHGNGWECVPHISRPRELPIENHRKSYCPGPQFFFACDAFRPMTCSSRAPRATHARVRKATVPHILTMSEIRWLLSPPVPMLPTISH